MCMYESLVGTPSSKFGWCALQSVSYTGERECDMEAIVFMGFEARASVCADFTFRSTAKCSNACAESSRF